MTSKTQSILEAARSAQTVDPARMLANLEALDARVASGDLGPEFGPDPVTAASTSSGAATLAKVAGALLVVGALAMTMRPSGSDGPQTARVAAPALAPAAAQKAPVQPTAEAPADVDEDEEPQGILISTPIATQPEPKAKAKSKAKTKVIESPIDRLEEEMALMSEARRALGRGDARKALNLLNQHGREFPNGEFKRERVVSRVTAMCALGQPEAAKRVAKRYLKTDSTSVHAQRIEHSCAGSQAK